MTTRRRSVAGAAAALGLLAVTAATLASGASGPPEPPGPQDVPVSVISLQGPTVFPPWTLLVAGTTLPRVRRRTFAAELQWDAPGAGDGCRSGCWAGAVLPGHPVLLVAGPFQTDGCTRLDGVSARLLADQRLPDGQPGEHRTADPRLVLEPSTTYTCGAGVAAAIAPQVLVAVPLDRLPGSGTLWLDQLYPGGGVAARGSITLPDTG